jgi:hypothetical protein
VIHTATQRPIQIRRSDETSGGNWIARGSEVIGSNATPRCDRAKRAPVSVWKGENRPRVTSCSSSVVVSFVSYAIASGPTCATPDASKASE